jgi:clan AA aspartic protease
MLIGPDGRREQITATIDTGFNGSISLPLAIVETLQLVKDAVRPVTLGDRSTKFLDYYRGEIEWQGVRRKVRVLCVEGTPLVGTALLKGFRLTADFVVDGVVTIGSR